MNLWNLLEMDEKTEKERPYVMAAAGAGGKTSFLYQLAREAADHGKKVLITTTTHMAKPEEYGVFDGSMESVKIMLDQKKIAVAGRLLSREETGTVEKIACPGEDFIKEVGKLADLVLIEADGSKRLPIKLPSEYEPVIPSFVHEIYVIFGLSALGKNPENSCHRWYLKNNAEEILASKGGQSLISEELMAEIMKNRYLLPLRNVFQEKRVTAVLNQADTGEMQERGERILSLMGEKGLVIQLKKEIRKIGLVYMASGFGRRFGSNKLLKSFQGKPLFLYGMEMLLKTKEVLEQDNNWQVTAVVSSQYDEILSEAEKRGMTPLKNRESQEGIAASIRLGTKALGDQDGYVYFVADQPYMKWETAAAFLKKWAADSRKIGCVAAGGKRGNPAVFSGMYKEELLSLTGDKGGSRIMKRNPGEVMEFQVEPKETEDIDTKSDMV